MGQYPTADELLQMIAEVADDGSNDTEFSEFLKVALPPLLVLPSTTVTLTGAAQSRGTFLRIAPVSFRPHVSLETTGD